MDLSSSTCWPGEIGQVAEPVCYLRGLLRGLEENKHPALLSECTNDGNYISARSHLPHYFESLSFDSLF